MKAVQITVKGKVQGVGFRYYTKQKAEECKLIGFVQNKVDGSVYIEAQGAKLDVDTFADWCRLGPEWSRVIECNISEMPLASFNKFEVK